MHLELCHNKSKLKKDSPLSVCECESMFYCVLSFVVSMSFFCVMFVLSNVFYRFYPSMFWKIPNFYFTHTFPSSSSSSFFVFCFTNCLIKFGVRTFHVFTLQTYPGYSFFSALLSFKLSHFSIIPLRCRLFCWRRWFFFSVFLKTEYDPLLLLLLLFFFLFHIQLIEIECMFVFLSRCVISKEFPFTFTIFTDCRLFDFLFLSDSHRMLNQNCMRLRFGLPPSIQTQHI